MSDKNSKNWISQEEEKELKEWQKKNLAEPEPKPLEEKIETLNLPKIAPNYYIVEEFCKKQPVFYDDSKIFWKWNFTKSKWEETDEVELLNLIKPNLVSPEYIVGKARQKIIFSFQQIGRERRPKEPPVEWVQLKDCIFDIKEKKVVEGITKSDYLFFNPIPWKLGDPDSTPTFDRLFTEWVGSDYKETLYEWLAYSLYRSCPIHIIPCLFGVGSNGKSQFLDVIDKLLGEENTASTNLKQIISNRFETFFFYRKLVCTISETDSGVLEETTTLKQLSAGDKTRFESKGKKAFYDKPYTKLIISTNAMKESYANVEGWWRRWLVIEFPNKFPNGKPIINCIPDEEFENLIAKLLRILPGLLEKGKFTNQGSIQDQERKYKSISNPLEIFIEDNCVKDKNSYIKYSELFIEYIQFLKRRGMQTISRRAFSMALDQLGYEVDKTTKTLNDERITGLWVLGVCFPFLSKNEKSN